MVILEHIAQDCIQTVLEYPPYELSLTWVALKYSSGLYHQKFLPPAIDNVFVGISNFKLSIFFTLHYQEKNYLIFRTYPVTRKSWCQWFVLLQVSAVSWGDLSFFRSTFYEEWLLPLGPSVFTNLFLIGALWFSSPDLSHHFSSLCFMMSGEWGVGRLVMSDTRSWRVATGLLCEAFAKSHSLLLAIKVSPFRLLMLKGLWKQPQKYNWNQEISKWQQGPIAK